MVDGVRGLEGHVVRHVVAELESTLDHVTILYHHVGVYPAMEIVPLKKLAVKIAVLVSYVFIHVSICIAIKWRSQKN